MRWLILAVLFSPPLWAMTELHLKDGTILAIPDGFFHDIDWHEDGTLTATNLSRSILVAYGHSTEDRDANILQHTQSAGLVEIMETFSGLGAGFELIPKDVAQDVTFSFYVEPKEAGAPSQLLSLRERRTPLGTAVFMMLGPPNVFHSHTNDFSKFVTNSQFQIRAEEQVTLSSFAISGLFLLLNLVFIGYGFQKISQVRNMKLKDE